MSGSWPRKGSLLTALLAYRSEKDSDQVIEVNLTKADDPFEFDVTVHEGDTETRHRVTMSGSTYQKLAGEEANPERFVEAAFEFLLDRESKESILSSFDITVISRYFPEFEGEIGRYL